MPYFDLTVSAVKSVSVLHASYRVAARQARDRGDQDQAAALDARADEIEAALMDSAREAVAWLERHATYTRTGHHSARTGEWRDGDGLAASLFLHHLSRDGDPQLHVHVAIWNRVQRADGADDKWRTLDSRSLHNQRLAVAPVADRILETRLSALGYVDGAPGGRQRRRGRRGQPGRDGPVLLPRGRGHRRAGPAGTRVRGGARQAAVPAHAVAAAPAGRAEHPPHQGPGAPHHRRADRCGRAHRGAAARRLGSPDGAAGKCRPCRRCTSRSRRSPPSVPGVHRPCWMMRPSARPRGSRWPRCKSCTRSGRWLSSGSRCTGRSPSSTTGTDGEAVVDEVARLAVGGRAGTDVVQVTAPDPADVTSLGVRASDGGSIYRPPNEERYCTLAHLDTEEQILAAAKRTVPQLVSERAGTGGRRVDRAERPSSATPW